MIFAYTDNLVFKTTFISRLLFDQKVQIWPNVRAKMSKVANPSMNSFYTETPTLASSGKSSVFLSYEWLPLFVKNEDVFHKLY